MKQSDIIEIQKEIGTRPDGLWGLQSKKAAIEYLQSLAPKPHPFPYQSDVPSFFPESGIETFDLTPYGVTLVFEGTPTRKVRFHKKAFPALAAALQEISKSEWAYVLTLYEGAQYKRPMRGGKRPSMHSYGVAIDFDSESNGMDDTWPHNATMPWGVIKIFAKHGFLPAAVVWGYDAMHFQATRF